MHCKSPVSVVEVCCNVLLCQSKHARVLDPLQASRREHSVERHLGTSPRDKWSLWPRPLNEGVLLLLSNMWIPGHQGQSAGTPGPRSRPESEGNNDQSHATPLTIIVLHTHTHTHKHHPIPPHCTIRCHYSDTYQFVFIVDIKHNCPFAVVTADLQQRSDTSAQASTQGQKHRMR